MKKCKYCDNEKILAKGLCNKHYKQMYRHGKIFRTIHDRNEIIKKDDYAEIVLYDVKGNEKCRAIIDLEDVEFCSKYKWCCRNRGYVITTIDGKKKLLHRLLLKVEGKNPIDHINGNPLDNRKSNLRECTVQQNTMNTITCKSNKSGIKGVSFDKSRNKWRAYITLNDKQLYLGRYDAKEEAIEARKQAEIKYFGEYSREYRKEVI